MKSRRSPKGLGEEEKIEIQPLCANPGLMGSVDLSVSDQLSNQIVRIEATESASFQNLTSQCRCRQVDRMTLENYQV